MTKRDMALRIAKETGLPYLSVLKVIQHLLDHMTEGLIAGDRFEFRDFGVFETVTRKSRIGRNPNQPANPVTIPARRVVKFKAGKKMRDLVLQSQAPQK